MNNKYPLKLSYTAKTAIWAGKRLKTEFGKKTELETVSESWELTVREDEMATVLNGVASGKTLAQYFEEYGYDSVSPDFSADKRFPLLVKLIDANDILSVQVHPDDCYAKAVENDSGKTEMWYIVDALDGARLVYGLKDGVSSEDFADAVRAGKIGDVMNYCNVEKGQTYFIPAGMLHAIGAGILIAEIQQNSDLTYRVYDFDRIGKDGKPRPLHVQKAMDVTRPYTEEQVNAVRYSRGYEEQAKGELLANCDFFKVRKFTTDSSVALAATDKSFVSLLFIQGDGYIDCHGERYPVCKGDSYFVPAGTGDFEVCGNLEFIASEI